VGALGIAVLILSAPGGVSIVADTMFDERGTKLELLTDPLGPVGKLGGGGCDEFGFENLG
jgi:hypothetical protein